MSKYYRRDGSGPIPFDSPEIDELFSPKQKRVAKTDVSDDVMVSTVFLALDHNWGDGPPLIFETMAFGGKYDQECERYATEAEAIEGHARWVAKVSEPTPDDVTRLVELIDASEAYDNSYRLAEYLLDAGVTLRETKR